jgi:hypothetical protein
MTVRGIGFLRVEWSPAAWMGSKLSTPVGIHHTRGAPSGDWCGSVYPNFLSTGPVAFSHSQIRVALICDCASIRAVGVA